MRRREPGRDKDDVGCESNEDEPAWAASRDEEAVEEWGMSIVFGGSSDEGGSGDALNDGGNDLGRKGMCRTIGLVRVATSCGR